jgi:biotin carboxyl carrier protein
VTFDVEVAGRVFRVEVSRTAGRERVTVDGRPVAVDAAPAGRSWSLLIGHRSHDVSVEETGGGMLQARVDGQLVEVAVRPATRHAAAGVGAREGRAADGPRRVVAPMPGRVVKVLVRTGDVVVPQQALMVIEAMKMENELRAASAGTVTDLRVAEGALVESGAVLAIVE